MQDHHLERLMALVGEEGQLYRELLECTHLEAKAVLAADAMELTGAGHRKRSLLARLAVIQERRGAALAAAAERLAPGEGPPTLRRLASSAPPPYDQRLKQARRQLKELGWRLADENRRLAQLVGHGLAFVDGAYRLLAQLCGAPVYHAGGALKPAVAAGKLHQRTF